MNFYEWMCGGPDYQYHTIIQSMDGDTIWYSGIGWLSAFILLEGFIIAYYFYLSSTVAKSKESSLILRLMSWRCLAMAISGFMFNFIRLWFPIYRLQVLIMVITFFLGALLVKKLSLVHIGFSDNRFLIPEEEEGSKDE